MGLTREKRSEGEARRLGKKDWSRKRYPDPTKENQETILKPGDKERHVGELYPEVDRFN